MKPNHPRNTRPNQAAFTRVDLLMIILTVAALSLLEVVALSNAGSASQSAACMENLRSLTRAWQMFDLDHHYLPPNPDDGNATPGSAWVPGQAGKAGAQEFNPDILTNLTLSPLFSYLGGKSADVFRCPADLRTGSYQGSDPQKTGKKIPCARSYSMNGAVGSNPTAKDPGVPTNGPWLDGQHTHRRYQTWRTYGKFDDVVDPGPSRLAVLLDEDADSLNDGAFGFSMAAQRWIDWPGTRHEGAGVISYADGHVEVRHWVDPRTPVVNHVANFLSVPGSLDHQWLSERISAALAIYHPLIVPRDAGVAAPDVKIVWRAQAGTAYRVETSDDLISWKPFESAVLITNKEASIVDAGPRASIGKYYRITPSGQ